jgi:hypothetical protein
MSMNRLTHALATVCFMTACVTDEVPIDEETVSQSATTTVLMGCTFPGAVTTVGTNECSAVEPERVTSILFTVNTALGPATFRSWKMLMPPGEKEVRRSGCGPFDTSCEIAVVPVCKSGPPIPSGRGVRRYIGSIASSPVLPFSGSGEIALATAFINPANCVAQTVEVQPVCNLPSPLPYLEDTDTLCRGVYLFDFSKIPGTTRYEAETKPASLDWSFAHQEFACTAEAVPQQARFRVQVGSPTHLRFRGCNDCGCSAWSPTVFMQRRPQCL